MKKKYITSLLMLGTATLGMVGLVVASQKDGGYLNATGEGTDKTYTFNSSSTISGYNEGADSSSLNYNQTISAADQTYITTTADLAGSTYQTDSFNGTGYYYSANVTTDGHDIIYGEFRFAVKGAKSVTFTITGDSAKTYSTPTFYVDILGSDGSALAESTEFGTQTITNVSSSHGVGVKVYFFNYTNFKIASLAITYDCVV